jgi:hypothetical protein
MVEFNYQGGVMKKESRCLYMEKRGVLVFLGGDTPTSQVYVGDSSPAPFSDITIYDISSGNYYQQTATGFSFLISRLQFWAAGVATADNSSFEM